LATATRLPVSTTHALVGALVGPGLLLAPGSVNWQNLPHRVVEPLLLSVVFASSISFVLSLLPTRLPECVCVSREDPPSLTALADPVSHVAAAPVAFVHPPRIFTGSVAECAVHGGPTRTVGLTINGAHWVSSGAASFARGLNDTPKIVAVGAFALVPAGMTSTQVLLVVAAAMATGSVLGGMPVARRLGEGVVRMSHVDGFHANLTTAVLVGLAANRGLPMSTTHVSTEAVVGTAGRTVSRLNARTLRDFLLAWTITPVFSGAVAAAVYALVR
jgi:PiT family inorganic phosphate transporter